jgi:hypothetical protein
MRLDIGQEAYITYAVVIVLGSAVVAEDNPAANPVGKQ